MSQVPEIKDISPGATDADPARAHYDVVRQLFREHNRALVKFLLTRLPSEQEARDVAQEAYVRLLELHRPGAISFLRGYLFRIAANLSVDRARRRSTQEKATELFEELELPGSEHEAITGEEFETVCGALAELSTPCRRAFVLHVVEGYRTPEVARLMRVDERTVRKYVTRAMVHCRGKLSGDSGGSKGEGQ